MSDNVEIISRFDGHLFSMHQAGCIDFGSIIETFEYHKNWAEQKLSEKGEFLPTVVGIGDEGICYYQFVPENSKQLLFLLFFIRNELHRYAINTVICIFESWHSAKVVPEGPEGQSYECEVLPVDDPNRTDCVCISYESDGFYNLQYYEQVRNEENQFQRLERMHVDNNDYTMNHLTNGHVYYEWLMINENKKETLV